MTITASSPIVLDFPRDRDLLPTPTRSYDFSRGDRRFFDHQKALDFAHQIAEVTGVRRSVRPDPGAPEFVTRRGQTLYLVQAIGS